MPALAIAIILIVAGFLYGQPYGRKEAVSCEQQSPEKLERLKLFGMTALEVGYNCRAMNVSVQDCQKSLRAVLEDADKQLR